MSCYSRGQWLLKATSQNYHKSKWKGGPQGYHKSCENGMGLGRREKKPGPRKMT